MGPFFFDLVGMMKKILTWAFLSVLYLVVFTAPRAAFAQNVYPGIKALNDIINRTPGINTVHIPGRTTVTSTAADIVNKSPNLRIPVPATATASAGSAGMAGAVARALRAGTFVGAATFVLPWLYDQSGYKVCPPPDFFCKPGPPLYGDPNSSWNNSWETESSYRSVSDPKKDCTERYANPTFSRTIKIEYVTPTKARCDVYDFGKLSITGVITYNYKGGVTCPAGYTQQGGTCVKAGPDVAVPEPELATAIDTAMNASAGAQGSVYDGMGANNIPVFGANSPVTVTAPPVTTATATQTVPTTDTDGSPATKVVTQTTQVTPVVQGSTFSTTNITYPAQTTYTTQVTNNVTNITYPPVQEVEQENAIPETPPVELPKDYNKENTQLAVLRALQGEGITTKVDTNTDPHVKPVQDATKANETEVGKVTAAAYGIVSWFPQVPTAACKNPEVPNATGSGKSAVEICKPVDTLKTFISGVLCFFVLVACVREVQSALKA